MLYCTLLFYMNIKLLENMDDLPCREDNLIELHVTYNLFLLSIISFINISFTYVTFMVFI